MLGLFKRKAETRSGYSDQILAGIEAGLSTKTASAAQSAALEAVAGLLARTLMAADVQGPDWLKVSPDWLGMVGRQLIRDGNHVSRIGMDDMGMVTMIPQGHWYATNSDDARESTWQYQITEYGPSSSKTRNVGRDELFIVRWASLPLEPERGRSPARLAPLTAKAGAESEKATGNEASGAVAQLLTLPKGKNPNSPEMAGVRTGLAGADGKTVMMETTQGNDRGNAPQRDWSPMRLGANPPAALVELTNQAFARMVAVCGASVSLFSDADGTSQREAWRRWHLSTVLPVAGHIEFELQQRIDKGIKIKLDGYATDLQARASSFQKLVAGGMDIERAARISGVLMTDD